MAVKIVVKSLGFMPKSRSFSTLSQVRVALEKNVIGEDWRIRYSDSAKECSVGEMLQRYSGKERKSVVNDSAPKVASTACPSCKGNLLLFFDRNELSCDSCGAYFDLKLVQRMPRTFLLVPQQVTDTSVKMMELKKALEILGLEKDFDEDLLKKCYRAAMKEFHPDKVAHLGKGMQSIALQHARKINHAYSVVRKHYGF